jgi:NUMOD3 motif
MINQKFRIVETNKPDDELYERSIDRGVKRPGFYVLSDGTHVYGGSSGAVNKRISRHKGDLKHNRHTLSKLQDSHNSGSVVTATITYTDDRDQAFDLEQRFLNKNKQNPAILNVAMNSRVPGEGLSPSAFNIQRIKETHTGKIVSEETRNKLSIANTGKNHSEETKHLLSRINTGKIVSDEVRQKISHANKGRIVSKDVARRISEAKKGKPLSEAAYRAATEKRSKKVICYGIEYASFTAASIANKVTDVTIRNWAMSDKHPEVFLKEDD